MSKHFFDYTDGDYCHSSGNIGFDSEGDMMMRLSDNMAMDMDSGDLHFTSSWDDDDDRRNNNNLWGDDD